MVTSMPWLQGELIRITPDCNRCLVFTARYDRYDSFFEIRAFPGGEVTRKLRIRSRGKEVSPECSGILDEGHATVRITSDGLDVTNLFCLDMSCGAAHWRLENPYGETQVLYLNDGTVVLIDANTNVVTCRRVEPGVRVESQDLSLELEEINDDVVDERWFPACS